MLKREQSVEDILKIVKRSITRSDGISLDELMYEYRHIPGALKPILEEMEYRCLIEVNNGYVYWVG